MSRNGKASPDLTRNIQLLRGNWTPLITSKILYKLLMETILVNVHPTLTIANIKNIVRTKARCFCAADNFLIFCGKVLADESTVSEIGLQKAALLVEAERLLGGTPKTEKPSSMAAEKFDPVEMDKAHEEDPTPTPPVRFGGMLQDMNLGDALGPPRGQGAEKDPGCLIY